MSKVKKEMRTRGVRGNYTTMIRWPGFKDPIEIPLKTNDPEVAAERKAEVKALLRKGVDPRLALKNFEVAVDIYLQRTKSMKAEKTHAMDKSRAENHLKPFFGGERIAVVADKSFVLDYIAWREKDQEVESKNGKSRTIKAASGETIRKELWLFKGIVNEAIPEFKLPSKTIVRYYKTEDEFERVRENCPDAESHDALMVARYVGFRLDDIAELVWPSINLFRNRIEIHPGKTEDDQELIVSNPIPDALREVLLRRDKIRRIEDDRVFDLSPNKKAWKRRVQRNLRRR